MALLTAEQIDRANDLPTRRVDVPEWGGEVLIATITVEEREGFEATQRGKSDEERLQDFRAKLLSVCLIDEKRQRLFGIDQIRRLAVKAGHVVDRLYDVAAEMNGIGAAKAVENAKKNSSTTPTSSSSTDSPASSAA